MEAAFDLDQSQYQLRVEAGALGFVVDRFEKITACVGSCGVRGLWCFQAVTVSGATHERTITGGGTASVKLAQFRAVNTLLGNLKTAFSGTYHAFNFAKYPHRYLAEFQYWFNRRFDLSVILDRLLRASSATSPDPERFIRTAEQCG